MHKIIIINGNPRSGKDTFVNIAKDIFKDVYSISTVDNIKKYAKLLGWDGKKDNKGRQLLSDMKNSLTKYNIYYSIDIVKNMIANIPGDNAIVFVFAREPEEIKLFANELDAETVFIKREDSETYSNHGDANVTNYLYDIYIENNGSLNNFRKKVVEYISNKILDKK